MVDISGIKAQIRSVLLSLGKTATEQEFRKAYYEIEGSSFNEVLRSLNINFHNLFMRIPDVAKIVYAHNQVFIQRVSNEATAHMENLTVNKYSKNFRGPKLVTKSGAIKGRPMLNPLNVRAPPYPWHTEPQRNVVPFQQNRSYGYQKPVQNNYNMKISVGVNNNNNRNVQPYFSNNASTSYKPPSLTSTSYKPPISTSNLYYKPPVSSGMSMNSSNFAHIANTSTRKDLSPEAAPKVQEMPKTSSIDSNLNILSKTTRMPPPSSDISSISSIADSESTRIADDFNDTLDMTSTKSEYESALDETLKKPQKVLTETPRIAPMASTTKQTSKPSVTSLLRSSKHEEIKELSKLDALADKVGNLKLNDNPAQHSNPIMVRQRLRSMRIFREALSAINTNSEVPSRDTESEFETIDIIELPEPIQNEEELFFFMKIIDVASPEKFAFQFSFEKLKDLSNRMNDFYNNLQDVKRFQANKLINNNIVAINCNGLWYRGQIKSFNETEASIQLIDSMKIKPHKVSCKNIFHLHQKFTTESPKSAFGKLHGLKPINGEWNMLSTAKLDSFHDKMLLATVKSINNGIYSLSIVAETKKFTRISDIFVEDGLAAVELEDLATEAVLRSLV